MANKYWLGSTSSSGSLWSVAGNWSGSGVPASNDVVYLSNSYRTASLNIDVTATVNAFYATGYTGSMSIGKAGNSVDLSIGGPIGDFILDPSMSITLVNAVPNLLYQNTHRSGSMNFNGVTWPGSFRPTMGALLTGSMTIANDYIVAQANSSTNFFLGQAGSAIYCRGNVNNGGGTLYTFLNNIDFYMYGTSSHTIGTSAASNTNFNCKNFYISSSNGSGSFIIYGINIITGYGQAATFTGSFEYTNGSGLRLSNIGGTNGQLAISTAVANQLVNVQVNNKTNPSDRLQFDPASVIALALNNVSPQNFTIMSDVLVNNNGAIQLNPGATTTVAYNSFSGSRFVFEEGSLVTNGGGGSNYNGTVTCSFEGPSTFTTNQANSNWRLPIVMDMGLNTLNFNNIGILVNTIEYRSGKISIPVNRYVYMNVGTFINAHKAGLAGANHFLMQAGATSTMNEFPSGTPSKPVVIRSTTAGSATTINLVDTYNQPYLPTATSYKIARNVIASNITVTGKPVYVLGRVAPQLIKFSLVSAPGAGGASTLQSRSTNIGIRYINEPAFAIPRGNGNNATTTIGGALSRNIGAMDGGLPNRLTTDPTTIS